MGGRIRPTPERIERRAGRDFALSMRMAAALLGLGILYLPLPWPPSCSCSRGQDRGFSGWAPIAAIFGFLCYLPGFVLRARSVGRLGGRPSPVTRSASADRQSPGGAGVRLRRRLLLLRRFVLARRRSLFGGRPGRACLDRGCRARPRRHGVCGQRPCAARRPLDPRDRGLLRRLPAGVRRASGPTRPRRSGRAAASRSSRRRRISIRCRSRGRPDRLRDGRSLSASCRRTGDGLRRRSSPH